MTLKKTRVRDIIPGDTLIIGGKHFVVRKNLPGYITYSRRELHLMMVGRDHYDDATTMFVASHQKFKVDKSNRKKK